MAFGTQLRLIARVIVKRRKRCCQVPSRGNAVDCNPVRCDPKLGCVPAHPPDHVAGIRHRIQRRDVFLVRQSVLHRDRDRATRCVSFGRVVNPIRRTGHPAAAMEKRDRGAVCLSGPRGPKHMSRQLSSAHRLVNLDVRRLGGSQTGH